jgi:hypothetical protein
MKPDIERAESRLTTAEGYVTDNFTVPATVG